MAKMQNEPKRAGTNRKVLMNALEALNHARVDVKNPQAIQDRIQEYLQFCLEEDIAPNVSGCASWLGINAATLTSWYSGTTGSPEHQLVASRFYGVLQDVWSQNMQENNVNPVSGIFMGKVFFGYKDTQEIVVNQRITNELTAADLIAESKMLPGGDNIIDGEATIIEEQPQPIIEQKEEPQIVLAQTKQKEKDIEEIKKKSLCLKKSAPTLTTGVIKKLSKGK